MNNKKPYQFPAEYHYLFMFHAGLSVGGAGSSGELYATSPLGNCESEYLSPSVFYRYSSFDSKNGYCIYGSPVNDFIKGKLHGDGYGCPLDAEAKFCNPYTIPISFRVAHQKKRILQSWDRL